MQTAQRIPLALIVVPPRLRTRDSNPEVNDHIIRLAESIKRYGLLQPILINEKDELQDGYCRLCACSDLGFTDIPVYIRETLSSSDYEEIELETNINRLGFTWVEIIRQVCKIHRTRLRLAALKGEKWTRAMTGELLGGYSPSYVDNCINLESKLADKRYLDCDGITDAVRLMLRDKEDALVAEQARRMNLTKAVTPVLEAVSGPAPLDLLGTDVPMQQCVACEGTGKSSSGDVCRCCHGKGQTQQYVPEPSPELKETEVNLSGTLFHGDMIDVLRAWPEACVDHIITDPPYGIEMENLEQSTTNLLDTERIAATHDVKDNLDLFTHMFGVCSHVLKPGGYFILWCDIMNWQFLYDNAQLFSFGVQRWPLVWVKTAICKNQMAHVNFTKTIEIAMVCRKGTAQLPRPVTQCHILCSNQMLDVDKVSNPFAKPFDLWKWIYESVSTPGQIILDPFAGEGSGVLAGLRLNRRVLAVEKDERQYNYLTQNVKAYWDGVFGKVKYV